MVCSYATAVTDSYRLKKAIRMNCHAFPREDNVRQCLKSLQRRDAQRSKEYVDKGRTTLLDGYNNGSLRRFAASYRSSELSPECHLRMLVGLLPGH